MYSASPLLAGRKLHGLAAPNHRLARKFNDFLEGDVVICCCQKKLRKCGQTKMQCLQ